LLRGASVKNILFAMDQGLPPLCGRVVNWSFL
jgi:hypothetical protein